jgi:hypothetical protein
MLCRVSYCMCQEYPPESSFHGVSKSSKQIGMEGAAGLSMEALFRQPIHMSSMLQIVVQVGKLLTREVQFELAQVHTRLHPRWPRSCRASLPIVACVRATIVDVSNMLLL